VGVVLVSTRRISDAQVDRAIELLRSGAHPIEAALAVGMSEMTLYKHLRRRGLAADGTPGRARDRRRPPTERRTAQRARRDAAVAMRERGLTFAEIGAELDVAPATAFHLWRAALGDPGRPPPRPKVAVRVPKRRVETREQLDRLLRSKAVGGLCGWCGRDLDDGETAYVDAFTVEPILRRGPVPGQVPRYLRAPVGSECAAPDLPAAVEGQQPDPCVSCGRGVAYLQPFARRERTTCSRRCQYAFVKRRRHDAGSDPPD
jgi:transposase-like protein